MRSDLKHSSDHVINVLWNFQQRWTHSKAVVDILGAGLGNTGIGQVYFIEDYGLETTKRTESRSDMYPGFRSADAQANTHLGGLSVVESPPS